MEGLVGETRNPEDAFNRVQDSQYHLAILSERPSSSHIIGRANMGTMGIVLFALHCRIALRFILQHLNTTLFCLSPSVHRSAPAATAGDGTTATSSKLAESEKFRTMAALRALPASEGR